MLGTQCGVASTVPSEKLNLGISGRTRFYATLLQAWLTTHLTQQRNTSTVWQFRSACSAQALHALGTKASNLKLQCKRNLNPQKLSLRI